jgi:hypothetical protein
MCHTGLHANEAAPGIECHAIDQSGSEKGNQQVDGGVGFSDVLVEVVHEAWGVMMGRGCYFVGLIVVVVVVVVMALLSMDDTR